MRELPYAELFAGTVIQVVVDLARLRAGLPLTLFSALVRCPAASVREVQKGARDVVKTGGAARAGTWMCAA